MIDTNNMISIKEAERNLSKAARWVDEHGSAVILKNNIPRYLMIDLSEIKTETEAEVADEAVMTISRRVIMENREVHEALAK